MAAAHRSARLILGTMHERAQGAAAGMVFSSGVLQKTDQCQPRNHLVASHMCVCIVIFAVAFFDTVNLLWLLPCFQPTFSFAC